MVPFDVRADSKGRVHISFESLAWFFVVTAIATTAGTFIWSEWLAPWAAKQGWLSPAGASTAAPVPVAAPAATPTLGLLLGAPVRRRRIIRGRT